MHTLKRMGLWAHENSAPHWFRNFPRTRRTYQQTVYYTFLLFSLVIFLENYKTLLVDQSFISWYLFYTFGQLNSSAKNGKRKIDCLFLLLYFALFPYQTRPWTYLTRHLYINGFDRLETIFSFVIISKSRLLFWRKYVRLESRRGMGPSLL